MSSISRAFVVASITFGASVVGMLLQGIVAADALTASKASIGAMAGLVSLLLALVLGLLVFTAFSVFTSQQSQAFSLAPIIAEIDLALEQYGAEAVGGRAGLRAALKRSRLRFFGDAKQGPRPFTFEETKATFAGMGGYFDSLRPQTELNKNQLATARDLARKFQDTQMQMARQLASPFPPYVITVVICWAAALFLGNGLAAAPNVISVLAHLAGSLAVGSAIFLILELSSPYTGLIRMSPDGLDRILALLGEVDEDTGKIRSAAAE